MKRKTVLILLGFILISCNDTPNNPEQHMTAESEASLYKNLGDQEILIGTINSDEPLSGEISIKNKVKYQVRKESFQNNITSLGMTNR